MLLLLTTSLLSPSLWADTDDFTRYEMSFKNFLTCELTRAGAMDYFKGKAFKIKMIDLFALQRESGMVIITGAVGCVVEDSYHLLYAAVGVETILDKEQVTYYIVRKNDFSILATELMQFPYKERCPWSRYWVDLD
ncbi:MAG: hypothetical protein DRH26_07500 [Deltaproteobacteria bacterium]|nr:MAG: hypothetical protein DRH26_07500 [Deltaproteobacteria bacterium]